jgi:hypothetical protein
MPEITTIESGKISAERPSKDLLLRLFKGQRAPYAVLKIFSPNPELDGEILIRQSFFVDGARLIGSQLNGREALKKLLEIENGSYSLLDLQEQPAACRQLKQELSISIQRLIYHLPQLPEELSGLTLS